MPTMDVLATHTQILHHLRERVQQLPVLEQKLADLVTLEHATPHLTSVVRDHVLSEIAELKRERDIVSNSREVSFYLMRATPLLEAYRQELQKPIRMSFMGNDTPVDSPRKLEIVAAYGLIAKDYVLMHEPDSVDVRKCTHCGGHTMQPMHLNLYSCTTCGVTEEVTQILFSYRDNERVNITTKYTYDRRIHFRDCINQFQGKQNSTISPKVYAQLRERLASHNLEIPNTATREDKYCNVTKRHITTFLKETGNSKHYEDLNLIYHTITGAPLDDISHLEDALIRDFDTLNELYDQLYIKTRKIERKNFINTQYVLFQLLRRHKYPCDQSDFNFLKTTERKCFHDSICLELFTHLKWKFSHVF
jgi:ribosomal protein S27AE